MAVVKRERSFNWEKEEKQLLREIMKPFIEIIEKKDLSTNTNKAKLKAWAEITEKFNRMNTRNRDRKQIINQWKVTKMNSKKEMSKYRQAIKKTGGGPRPPSPTPDTLELVDLLPREFEVDYNIYDCDGASKEEQQDSQKTINNNESVETYYIKDTMASNHPNIVCELLENKENIGESSLIDSQGEPPAPSFTPKRTGKKTPTSKKNTFDFGEASFQDMHHFRVLENERLQKEHNLRIEHSKELHEQTLKNLKLQHEILSKQLENLNKNV